jgi:hypothetical protein
MFAETGGVAMRHELCCGGYDSIDSAGAGRSADQSAGHTGARWRAALDTLIGAPVRLQRYRHLHAEVIEDALRAYDCGSDRGHRL